MTIQQTFRKFDAFKKVPRDLSEGTNSGGIISIATILIIVFYIYSQTYAFLNPAFVTDLSMDQEFTRQELIINLQIHFPRYPCEIISLDYQDVMMSHFANIESIHKYRLDRNGERIDSTNFEILKYPDLNKRIQLAEEAFEKGYGCRLSGFFNVKEVPGNFHISSHPYRDMYAQLLKRGKIQTIDVSHKIQYLFFGSEIDLKKVMKAHPESEINRLNGHSRSYSMGATPHSYTSHYHLDIVPTTYKDAFGQERNVYQYTWNHNSVAVEHMPCVYFIYHIGGMKVEVFPRRNITFRFMLNLCAVIGGIYALANLISTSFKSFMDRRGYELIN